MDNNPKVSIIVPVYNMEELLNKCIKSLVEQTYLNIDIIIIDDGSQDKSGEIAESWKRKDGRIQVIHHETNKGIACGFKTGLANVQGEYILFVDSDNYIHKSMIQGLVNIATKHNADIVQCEAVCYTDGEPLEKKVDTDLVNILEGEMIINDFLHSKNITNNLAAKLIKGTLFTNIIIPEGHQVVDTIILPQLLNHCKKYVYFNGQYYFAFQAPNSISRRNITEWRLNDLLYSNDFIEQFINTYWPKSQDYLYLRKIKTSVWAYNEIFLSDSIRDKDQRLSYFRKLFLDNYQQAKVLDYYRALGLKDKLKYFLFEKSICIYNKLLVWKFKK